MILDATAGPTRQNKRIASVIMENKKGCIILVNKWDLAEETVTQRQYGKALREELPFLAFVPLMFASAKTGFNIRKTIEAVDYVAGQVKTQLTTGLLNRVLREAWEKTPPPIVKGRRAKFFYTTQVGIQPVRLRIFVNDPGRVSPNYQAYLEHALRRAFGLEGAPIDMQFRARSNKSR